MASPSVDTTSITALFTLDSPSKKGQAEAGVVAALYFIAWASLMVQVPLCKGKYYAAVAATLFATARGVGYIYRALAEQKVTKSRFEAYLILTSAATFLFIGALGSLLAHWFERCSGKSHLEVRLPGGKTLSVARLMRLLHIVGIVFAAFGISGALNLFNAKTMADIASAQQDRKTSNRGFVALMGIYTAFALACTLLSWTKARGFGPGPSFLSRTVVVAALSAACGLLLIRTVFGLLSIDHPKFTNQPRLLYTLEVLPELLALYIVAAPGFMPAVGRDADQQQHKPGVLPAGAALQSENVPA